ncbi:MAG: nicotinamide mononucleotide transporter pnuc [Flavobacteriales bacterium]|nr:nicotinamide mononucleotide transporter pnuc [Flavobacteriales bacterium]|tara:strand:- start:9331 stop:9936 length:606 start_codon:yes stop_codon:yes gene_type:complete
MISFFNSLWGGIVETSFIEFVAVFSTTIYVFLAAKRMLLCWLFAFIGSSLFVYLCYISQLYIESILQLFYVVMAVIGWLSWKDLNSNHFNIKKWSFYKHLIIIIFSSIITLNLGFIFDKYSNQVNPYIDAGTTCFSLVATYMVTKKIIGNWIYWIFIDLVSMYLYAERSYYLTAVQYGVFSLLALYGFITWQNEYKRQNKC